MKRGKPLTRKTPLRSTSPPLSRSKGLTRGSAPLKREKGLERAASQAARAARAPRRWMTRKGPRCEVCGRSKWRVEQEGLRLVIHHAVYAQHVEGYGGDVWDPRNAMTVCDGPGSCHAEHHSRKRPIPAAKLPAAVFEFARALLGGPAAYEYLRRRYCGADPRLDDLLVEV